MTRRHQARHRQETKLCEAEHTDGNEKTVYPGLRVCGYHRHRAGKALAMLPSLYDELADYLRTRGTSDGAGRVSGTTDPGLTLDDRTVDARTEIRTGLREWVDWALQPRPVAQKATDGKVTIVTRPLFTARPVSDSPRAMVAWIGPHLDWFLAQSDAPAFVEFVIRASGTARRRRQPNPAKRTELGPCPVEDCTGNLWAITHPADDLLPPEVICDAAPINEDTGKAEHIWPARYFLDLGQQITGRPAQERKDSPA